MKIPNQTVLLVLATIAFIALAFTLFGVYTELKNGNRNYVRYQDSLRVRYYADLEAKNHPKTREEWMKNLQDSARLQFDSVLVGDSSRNIHLGRYYDYLARIDSIFYNDPARYDDVATDWTQKMDSITATHKLYGK